MFGQDERSPLWGMAAGGSLIAGAAIMGVQNKSAFARALASGGDTAASVTSRLADAPGFATLKNMIPSTAGVSDSISSLVQSMSSNPVIKSDIGHTAYRSIMAGKTATHEEALAAMRKVTEQASPLEAYEAAVEQAGILGGDIGVLESEIKGINKLSRQAMMERSSVSKGGIGIGFQYTKFNELSQSARQRFESLQTNLQQALGEGRIDWKFKNVEDVIGNQRVVTPMATASIAGESFNIPLANTGYTYGGSAYTARYATRGGYTATGYKMGYSELSEEVLRDAISGSNSSFEMKQRLSQAHQTLIDQMNNRDSAARAAGVWTLPESVMPSGGLARSRILSQEAVAIGGVAEDEIISLLGEGIYPYTSPTAAGKGTMATQNLATGLFGDLGVFMSAEQRPTQFIRGEWGVTAEAKRRAKAFKGTFGQYYSRLDRKMKGKLYDPLIYGGQPVTSGSAYSAPKLTTFYAKPSETGYASQALDEMLSAEEGVISKSVAGQMEYERVVQKKITLDEGMRANKQLMSAVRGRAPGTGVIPLHIPGNEFVGIERGTGKDIITESGSVSTNIIGAEVTGKNEATVFMRERRTLSSDEYWKFFSEENKFMAAAADDQKMREVLRAAGLGDRVRLGRQNIEAVFSGKLVARNKMALITQQTEAMSMFLGRKIDMKARMMSPDIQAFLSDPSAALDVASNLKRHGANAHIEIQKNLMGMAKKWGFNKEELGFTFGLADEDAISGGVLTLRERIAVRKSVGVFGLGKMMLGDIATEGGSGRIGTFETTGFRALAMKGEVGESYAAELSRRILGKGQVEASDKMYASVIGEQGFIDRLRTKTAGSLADIEPEKLLQAEGRYLDLGRSFKELGGSSKIYVPGLEEASEFMAPVVTPKGKRVQSPVAQGLMSLRGALRSHAAGKMKDEELEATAAALRNAVAIASENQAYARGKVLGSRVLTGVRRTFEKDADTFRISTQTAQDMFDELLGRATSDSQRRYLQKQKDLVLAGKTLTGGMWRHPTSGPESFQFVKYKVDRDLADGMVAAPKQFGKLEYAGGKSRKIDVSAMVGFKGDFDRDQFVLSAIANRDTANRASKLVDHSMRDQYSKYLFNHYSMKDAIEGRMNKKSVLNMTSKEALESGYRKLTTAKTTTGQVNIALQKLKMGVAATAPEQYRPLAEMFWHLEEAAIGGKHGVQGTELYQAIAQAADTGGSQGINNMEAVFRSLMGDKRTISGSVVDSFGNKIAHQLDYDPRQWAEVAISSYDAVRNDVNVVMRAARTAKGESNFVLQQMIEQFNARRAGSVDIAQSLMQQGADEFTTKTTRMMRKGASKASGLLSVVKRGSKPLMVGAAAAAGIMLMAPSTSGVLRKPEGVAGGRNMPPEDYGPPNGGPMQPPPPGPNRSPRVYDVGSGNRTSHANIRMRINDLDSSSRDFMASARSLSDGSGVNINARDDRSVLDPRLLAGKIHERL